MRTDVDLLQTEWDVCARELQAATERVHTQIRVRVASAELADLNRTLDEQDLWLDSTSPVEKSNNEAELRNNSADCQVSVVHLDLNFINIPLGLSSCIANYFINITVFSTEIRENHNEKCEAVLMKVHSCKWPEILELDE